VQSIKEGKPAVKMTRISWQRFQSNEVTLLLSLLAHEEYSMTKKPRERSSQGFAVQPSSRGWRFLYRPNRSDIAFTPGSHAWFRQGSPKPASRVLSKEK